MRRVARRGGNARKQLLADTAKSTLSGSVIICGTAVLILTGCGENSGGATSSEIDSGQEGAPVATSNKGEYVIYGDACAERDDIYQIGLLHIADGKGGIDQQKFDDLANNVTIKDGKSGVRAPEITSIPAGVLDQIRTSVTLLMNDGELAPAVVNLYGERQSDWDDYDGKLNSGLKACV